jgi:Ni,Fe-hydrogenase III large subunit
MRFPWMRRRERRAQQIREAQVALERTQAHLEQVVAQRPDVVDHATTALNLARVNHISQAVSELIMGGREGNA